MRIETLMLRGLMRNKRLQQSRWRARRFATLCGLACLSFPLLASAQLFPPPPPQDPNAPPQDPAAPPQDPNAPLFPIPEQPLAPPAPVVVPPEEQETYRRLEQADREDSGRGLQFVWIAPEVGFQWAALDGLSNSELIDDQVSAGSGLALGGTVGLRWLYYTVGARFRYGLLDEFTLWSAGGDFALRVPLGEWEYYGMVGASYVRAQDFAANDALREAGTTSDLQVGGVNARLGGGVDYYVTPVFSTGVSVDAEAMFLSRDALGADTGTIYDASGSAVGLSVTGLLVLGLHF